MKFRVELDEDLYHDLNPSFIFDDWDEAIKLVQLFISQGYEVRICGVIEDE